MLPGNSSLNRVSYISDSPLGCGEYLYVLLTYLYAHPYCLHMPPVATAKPNGPKIAELIERRGYSLSGFGRSLGRHPQTMWNIVRKEPDTSVAFLNQIAHALSSPGSRVRLRDISDAGGDEQSDAEPEVPAA